MLTWIWKRNCPRFLKHSSGRKIWKRCQLHRWRARRWETATVPSILSERLIDLNKKSHRVRNKIRMKELYFKNKKLQWNNYDCHKYTSAWLIWYDFEKSYCQKINKKKNWTDNIVAIWHLHSSWPTMSKARVRKSAIYTMTHITKLYMTARKTLIHIRTTDYFFIKMSIIESCLLFLS